MSRQTYAIKPLVWRHEVGRFREMWEAPAIEGSYKVERWRDDKGDPWRGWSWGFEDMQGCALYTHDCRTAEEGMAATEEHWRKSIERFLEVTHE